MARPAKVLLVTVGAFVIGFGLVFMIAAWLSSSVLR
jgi:hypothetical protein